jgi:phospholipase A1
VQAAAAPAALFPGLRLTPREGCRDERFSTLSRLWELERGSDCGVFGLRSFRPLVASAAIADTVNRQPTSDNPANNASVPVDYRSKEMRLQLSVRSKIAQGLLTPSSSEGRDSLWFAYTQQSYWQLFTPSISRPFRSTDHEPELIYVHPLQAAGPGWKLRYGGAGVVHHSNGQSLPYSRSWNRLYLMAGAESGSLALQGRLWRRIDEDRAQDDNPNISDYYGRAELQARWRADPANLLIATARHNLKRHQRGSMRLEWFRTLREGSDGPAGGLQRHAMFFTGYGDSLLDFNRRRSVFTIGVSLAEW